MNPEDEELFGMGQIDMTPPKWDAPGICQCGQALPPQQEWKRAGNDWANIVCAACGWMFVDEETYLACYPPEGGPFVPCEKHDLIEGPHHHPDCHYYDDELNNYDVEEYGEANVRTTP